MPTLTHTDESGTARMVDVSRKPPQLRVAVASGHITLSAATRRLIRDNQVKKGAVLTVAQIAGIQAAKRTAELIPLCHPLSLDQVTVLTVLDDSGVLVTATARCIGRTGAEMESLTAVSVALLTIYDMCKAVDKAMVLGEIRLLKKEKTSTP